MKTNKIQILVIVLLFSVINVSNLFAQELLRKTPLKNQIENASLVVEGAVTSKKSFWKDNLIYTANTVEVFKIFKGEFINKTVEVITEGGVVGLTALKVSTSLKLQIGDIGVFMLDRSNINSKRKNSNVQFTTHGAIQGFYKYNLIRDVAVNAFNKKQGISTSFYNEITKYTKSKIKEINSFNVNSKRIKSNKGKMSLVLGINSFSPSTAIAGVGSLLTINGADFGSIKGKVGFSSADLGGNENYVDALNTQVITWTNSQITVEIPSEAGTGKIRVTHNNGSTVESVNEITITYSESNVVFDNDDFTDTGGSNGPNEPIAYPVQHIGANGSGGYTWEMETNFFNDSEFSGAKAAFGRAFDNWVCNSGVNWVISNSATSTDVVANDGINVVRFDIGNELDEDVLGTCYSWYSGCGSGASIKWYVSELDIVFDDNVNWNFGPGVTTNVGDYDFESVVLHELGHGHQLGHVIDTNDVMNYALSFNEEQRVIGSSNSMAANNIQTRSTGSMVCGKPLMVNSSCPLSVEDEELNKKVSIYPNPSSGSFYIKNESFTRLQKMVIYDVSGRLISNIDISDTSHIITINLTGITKGMCFVNIYSANGMVTKKIVFE